MDPPTQDYPDYDCPVCRLRVRGEDTPAHSRACRTARCRFCRIEYPLLNLEQHESTCDDPIRCRFCRLELPKQDVAPHEATCNEPARCRLCRNVFPIRLLAEHEPTCNLPRRCRGCRIAFPPKEMDRHESMCHDCHPNFLPIFAPCMFCNKDFITRDLDRHELECSDPTHCRGCLQNFPRSEFPSHIEECPELIDCRFNCLKSYLPRDIEKHEESCNEPTDCPKCFKKFPRKELHLHID